MFIVSVFVLCWYSCYDLFYILGSHHKGSIECKQILLSCIQHFSIQFYPILFRKIRPSPSGTQALIILKYGYAYFLTSDLV